jgi:ADP-ribose pyrophosphatase YjhB (NUDIX family)
MEKLPHKIQLAILARLREQSPARYGYLKPHRVEGNVFVYHLKALMDQGIVEKVAEGYGLTTEGHNFVDRLSEDGLGIRIQPRIATLIALRHEDGSYLLYERQQEPYRGLIGFPYGKIHLGETIAASAARECEDKIGLEIPLVHAGDVYVGVKGKGTGPATGELLMHTLFHVFIGTIIDKNLVRKEGLFWEKPADITVEEQIPGFHEIADLAEKWRENKTLVNRFFGEFWLHR